MLPQPFLEEEESKGTKPSQYKVLFACLFFQGEVCTFSSAGRAPDSYSGCPGFESLKVYQWPVGQAVKTAASHAANMGSSPVRVTTFWLTRREKFDKLLL